MTQYELLYIVPAKYTDDEIKGIMKKIADLVAKYGGKLVRHEDAGKLKFAYPINHIRHGNYILAEFEAEPTAPKGIENDLHLGLTNEVLRFTLAKSEKLAWGQPLKLSSYVAPLSQEADDAAQVAKRVDAPIMQAPVKEVAPEDLDKKIDAALAEDVAKL
ncbi:MAG: 30S ribosomal protein S6 [bacterium]